VLNHLTKYLFQYKSVSIPSVGTLQIVQQPPQLNVVDKIILPPSFSVVIRKEEEVSAHQLQYLENILQRGHTNILSDLRFFGDKLQEKINGPGFEWNGLGTITRSTQTIPLMTGALEPVPAERVLRQHVQHSVLVGDQQMLSGTTSDDEIVGEKTSKRSLLVIIGWVLLFFSLLFIAFQLYSGRFRVNGAGSKQAPSSHHSHQFTTPLA
jgi:hypothetical protein